MIRLSPKDMKAYKTRGLLYSAKHDFDHAVSDFSAILKFDSTNIDAYANRMKVYLLKGDFQKAAEDGRSMVRINPDDAHNCTDLAALLAICPDASVRNGNQAVDFARHACELTEWKLPYCLVTLAAAYAESGDFPQAVKYQKQVLTMRPWTDLERKEIQAHLELYQQGKPFHEAPSH
jgi:tetratricopeptide (TPR) repeat protein